MHRKESVPASANKVDMSRVSRERQIPHGPHWDATIPLLYRGYPYISQICDVLRSDIFQTRLMLRPAICMRGEEAAKLFYDVRRFRRAGAAPPRIQRSLLGKGGIHGLDGQDHCERKQLFMSFMGPKRIESLSRLARASWERQASQWAGTRGVQLQTEAQEVLCRAVCQWCGVELDGDLKQRANDLASMVDSFGAVGPRFWRGTSARRRTERWAQQIVREIRTKDWNQLPDTPAHVLATWRDSRGRLLDEHTAAVELLNLLRPTVAVSYLIVFSALALHQHPCERRKILTGGDSYLRRFVQEVRRFFPFAPIMGALTNEDVSWEGYLLPRNTLVILDLFGTNHDPRTWAIPFDFSPERFNEWNGSAFNFIPQGGGDFCHGHRCAGEWITIEQMKVAVEFLTSIEYEVPMQDFRYPLNRIPTKPADGFVIRLKNRS
jgi:fatty-acid peroxygenase